MKRDMDLIRSILLLAEAQPAGELLGDFSSLGADHATAIEHVRLVERSGLVEASFIEGLGDEADAVITRLTPAGHDFIERARAPAMWAKAKDTITKTGAGLTVEALKVVLGELAKAAIKAHLGT